MLQPGAGSRQGSEIIDWLLPVIQKGLDVRPFIVVAGMLTQSVAAAAPRMGGCANG